MYYRIFDQETKSYSPFGYNESDQKNFKKDAEFLLQENLSFNDVTEISSLKMDQYKIRLKTYGFLVEESTTPFESLDSESWEFNDEDDDVFGYSDFNY